MLNKMPPAKRPARSLYTPVIQLLVRSLGYPDIQLPAGHVKGVDIVGKIPPTKALARREVKASTSIRGVKPLIKVRNKMILRALARSTNRELVQKGCDLTQYEYKKGWISEPIPVTKSDRLNTILSPRFCIREQQGLQEEKYRVIDDLTKSHVNMDVGMEDTYCPKSLGAFMALARLLHTYGAKNLRIWSVDFPNAYKTIRTNETSPIVSHVRIVNPTDMRP